MSWQGTMMCCCKYPDNQTCPSRQAPDGGGQGRGWGGCIHLSTTAAFTWGFHHSLHHWQSIFWQQNMQTVCMSVCVVSRQFLTCSHSNDDLPTPNHISSHSNKRWRGAEKTNGNKYHLCHFSLPWFKDKTAVTGQWQKWLGDERRKVNNIYVNRPSLASSLIMTHKHHKSHKYLSNHISPVSEQRRLCRCRGPELREHWLFSDNVTWSGRRYTDCQSTRVQITIVFCFTATLLFRKKQSNKNNC